MTTYDNKVLTKNTTQHIKNSEVHKLGFEHYAGKEELNANVLQLSQGIRWFQLLIDERMNELSKGEKTEGGKSKMDNIPVFDKKSPIQILLNEFGNSEVEIVLLFMSFSAWFRPATFAKLTMLQENSDARYVETGGLYKKNSSRFIPTLQTAIFLLSGKNVTLQGYYSTIISDHRLFREGVLHLRNTGGIDNYPFEQIPELDLGYYHYLINGKKPHMDITPDFPASLMETNKTLNDLVLKESTRAQLDIIMNYAKVKDTLFMREGVDAKINQGYLALLYGPPGTGKTFSVSVISKELGIEAYRVDLSRVISKYIGETEKNLEKIFTRFEDKNCILMFDEADALFGKRTEVKDAKDRFANQEVAYLLQRVETFPGLVILASNYNQNLDSAFKRRILSSVYFAQPDSEEREILWRNAVPEYYSFESENSPAILAEKHSLTGANIANIIKLCCIQAESKGEKILRIKDIEPFIFLEMKKEGSTTTRKQIVNHQRIVSQ